MKAEPSQSNTHSAQSDATQAAADEWNASDPLWNLLDQASKPQENAFFARNVVREVRLLEQERPSLSARLTGFFTMPKLALGAMACGLAIVAWQIIPSAGTPQTPGAITQDNTEQAIPNVITSEETYLSDIVMQDTLTAAAEDPTIFTRDEVAALIGL